MGDGLAYDEEWDDEAELLISDLNSDRESTVFEDCKRELRINPFSVVVTGFSYGTSSANRPQMGHFKGRNRSE